MISSHNLSTTLLFDVFQRWIHYLNRCVVESASDVVEAPGVITPFYLEPILVDLEGGATSTQSSRYHWTTSLQEGGQKAGMPQRATAAATARIKNPDSRCQP